MKNKSAQKKTAVHQEKIVKNAVFKLFLAVFGLK